MTTYMICDGDGNALTCGVQEHELRQVARRMANSRGESVWVSADDSESISEVEPEDK